MFVHCLGPKPTCHATRVAQARGLMSGKTDRGICFPLNHARTRQGRARIQETKRFEEPTRSPERPRSSQRSKISAREGTPLPGRRARQGARPPPELDNQSAPAGPTGAHGGRTTPPTTQERPTSSISAVSSRKMIKWQPFATWQPFPTEETHR